MSNPTVAPRDSASAFIVKLATRPDFTKVETMPRGPERKAAAWKAISDTAAAASAPFVKLADQLKTSGAITGYTLLTSPPALIVTPAAGKSSAAMKAFEVTGVKSLYDNSNGGQLWPSAPGVGPAQPQSGPWWGLDVVHETPTPHAAPTEKPYGVTMVGAPEAWAQGADGHGLVFGSIDTGADVTHEALNAGYRGRNADGTLSNDYNWLDLDPNGSKVPVDSEGHGTHTVGTAVGHGTGVAPGAQWISVHGLTGSVDAALRALQFMQAPTKLDGSAPDATKAPDVVGMSWWMGQPTQDLFQESIRDLRAAGIEVVKSAGNNGPGAGSITSPGQYPEIIATGAVDKTGKIASFSSRGPAPFPKGSSTPKPDFSAPGVDVLSAMPGNKYGTMSGTSMAQPHMSGVILDVLSKYPQLTHDQLIQVLQAGATDAGKPGIDAEYGAGIVNIPATLAAAAKLVGGNSAHTAAATPAA